MGNSWLPILSQAANTYVGLGQQRYENQQAQRQQATENAMRDRAFGLQERGFQADENWRKYQQDQDLFTELNQHHGAAIQWADKAEAARRAGDQRKFNYAKLMYDQETAWVKNNPPRPGTQLRNYPPLEWGEYAPTVPEQMGAAKDIAGLTGTQINKESPQVGSWQKHYGLTAPTPEPTMPFGVSQPRNVMQDTTMQGLFGTQPQVPALPVPQAETPLFVDPAKVQQTRQAAEHKQAMDVVNQTPPNSPERQSALSPIFSDPYRIQAYMALLGETNYQAESLKLGQGRLGEAIRSNKAGEALRARDIDWKAANADSERILKWYTATTSRMSASTARNKAEGKYGAAGFTPYQINTLKQRAEARITELTKLKAQGKRNVYGGYEPWDPATSARYDAEIKKQEANLKMLEQGAAIAPQKISAFSDKLETDLSASAQAYKGKVEFMAWVNMVKSRQVPKGYPNPRSYSTAEMKKIWDAL